MISDTVQLLDTNYVNDRIIQILAKINNINLAITNCYAPTNEAKTSQKEAFYRALKTCIKNTPMKYKHVITGNLNATIGEDSYGLGIA